MRKQISLVVILLAGAACADSHTPTAPSVKVFPVPTQPPPARAASSPGQYLVGVDIEPGRYFSAPASSDCNYEVDGIGDPLRTFVGPFIPQQWIVDILPSDKIFKTASECGTWIKDSPRLGAQTTIPPGMWVVGSQIAPGTYTADSSGDCSFNRLRGFHSLAEDSVIEYGYVYQEPAVVTISPGDIGFSSTSGCGTWRRASASE